MSEHTPGPWVVFDDHPDKACYTIRPDIHLDEVAVIYRFKSNPHEHLADARLIAAAPELLEALEELTQYVDQLETAVYAPDDAAMHESVKSARAAIAKAKGEEHE